MLSATKMQFGAAHQQHIPIIKLRRVCRSHHLLIFWLFLFPLSSMPISDWCRLIKIQLIYRRLEFQIFFSFLVPHRLFKWWFDDQSPERWQIWWDCSDFSLISHVAFFQWKTYISLLIPDKWAERGFFDFVARFAISGLAEAAIYTKAR